VLADLDLLLTMVSLTADDLLRAGSVNARPEGERHVVIAARSA
jgi:hypothetical protein